MRDELRRWMEEHGENIEDYKEDETIQDLIEDGVDFEEIEREVEQFIKKLKGRKRKIVKLLINKNGGENDNVK